MHVPKPGYKILTRSVDDPRVLGQLEFLRIGNRGDAIAGDDTVRFL